MNGHPDELKAIEAHKGPLPSWLGEKLDRRDREEAGTEEDGEVVMARLLAKHTRPGWDRADERATVM